MKTFIIHQVFTALAASITLSTASLVQAGTLTDSFASRPVETGVAASFSGHNSNATLEFSEPRHSGDRKGSLWGAWTAPADGNVIITTNGSSFNTVLAIYTGNSLGSLHPVAHNDNVQHDFTWSRVSFPTKAGVTYSLAVDGATIGSHGTAAVDVAFISANQPGAEVGTNSFASRPALPSTVRATGVSDTRLATEEVDEPKRIGSRDGTVWWKWVAPSSGSVVIDTLASDFNTVLTVYVGGSLTTLSEVAINRNALNVDQSRVTFQTHAGMEYQIQVDGETIGSYGNAILNLALQPSGEPNAVPGKNSFAQRGLLTGARALGVANNAFFNIEVDEQQHGSDRDGTSWWQWTAPASGLVTMRTEGSETEGRDFNTFLAVYRGSVVGKLSLVANDDDALNVRWSEVQFVAERGEAYQIMVDGRTIGSYGNIALTVNQGAAPDLRKPDTATYFGLIGSNPATPQGAGFAVISVTGKSKFSLAASIGMDRIRATGRIGEDGSAQVATRNGYLVALEFDAAGRAFKGTVTRAGRTVGTFTVERPAYSRKNRAPESLLGRREVLLFPDLADANMPQDTGFGVMKVKSSGLVIFAGRLGNGSRVSQAVPLLTGDTWAFYARKQRTADIVSGSLQLDADSGVMEVLGQAVWHGATFAGNLEVEAQ